METINDARPPSQVGGIKYKETSDDEKFMNFFAIVQSAAKALGKVFFLWTGEGNDIVTDELDGENLSGWLVDAADADRFEAIWREPRCVIPEDLDETFSFAKWSVNESGGISIRFE